MSLSLCVAGYIAVELAGVLNGLGTDTSLFVRRHCALRDFDSMLSSYLDTSMKKAGENIGGGGNLPHDGPVLIFLRWTG